MAISKDGDSDTGGVSGNSSPALICLNRAPTDIIFRTLMTLNAGYHVMKIISDSDTRGAFANSTRNNSLPVSVLLQYTDPE